MPFLENVTRGRSISRERLERFFLKRGLGLRPVDERERDRDVWLDPLTRGSELHDVYAAQRDAVVELRNAGDISNEVMHRIEREIDLEESRLEV